MRILIIGEYSAFAKHLKTGFKCLGHEVFIVQTGDGFKAIKGDSNDMTYECQNYKIFNLPIYKSYHLRAPLVMKSVRKKVSELPFLDIIVVINAFFVARNIFYPGILLSEIKKRQNHGTKVIMSACGNDPAFHLAHHDGLFKYSEELFGCPKFKIPLLRSKEFDWLIKHANVIIPTSYGYWHSMSYYLKMKEIQGNLHSPVPLPISIEDTQCTSSRGRKIVIFHGVIREQFKGTQYFIEAMDKLQKKYPDKVDCRIDGKMPYDQYMELFKEMDILLDQTNSYGMGINAEIGMMKGKVVFTGNEPENIKALGFDYIPVVNAKPNVDYLFAELERLILNPQMVDDLKKQARSFAVRNFDSTIVARKYLSIVNL